MSIIKVVELIGISDKGWEEAARIAVKGASQTIKNITGVEIVSNTASVKDGELTEFKACVKVAFLLTDR